MAQHIIKSNESDINDEPSSFICSRDPSYLTVPGPTAEIKKNLCSVFEDEDSLKHNTNESLIDIPSQTIKVFLRLKPMPRIAKLPEEHQNAYCIVDSQTLLTTLPSSENLSLSMMKTQSLEMVCRKYSFTEIFGSEINQSKFFEEAIKHQMIEFLSGQNCTIMTYGTTNSGKSYTLQGTTTSPGIIPRGLEFVFANINPKSSPSYKPVYNCDVAALSTMDKTHELESKNKLLALGLADRNQHIAAYKQMQKLLKDEMTLKVIEPSDANYSVWISFAEIYNETIYDLLSNDSHKDRQPLRLATDIHGRPFIKGLKYVSVNCGSEAFQILMAGQYNLKIAATTLNQRSSRSHCIFTIKLLKYYKENNPEIVDVSTISFCDLAGSERLKKTLNVGDRLKEAQNINTSLLVLGRCLKSIYEGQSIKHRNDLIGPFRESKLTRLFQQALSGKEPMTLIVNVNQSPNLYVETQNVLNFAAIAKKIILQPKKSKHRKSKSRFSHVVVNNTKSIIDWDDTSELDSLPDNLSSNIRQAASIPLEEYEEILRENEKLRKEISAVKASALNRDFEIRREMAETYSKMLKNSEDQYKNQLKEYEEQQEELMEYNVNRIEAYWKSKLYKITNRKRSRSDYDDEYDEDVIDIDELQSENTILMNQVESLKTILKETRKAKDSLESAKNTAEYELSLAKEDSKKVNNILKSLQNDFVSKGKPIECIGELNKQLVETNGKNKTLKNLLNEAKDEYIDLTAEIERKNHQIHERDDMIMEQTEKLRDLENQFEVTNSILTGKIKYIEELEEKLDGYLEQLNIAEKRIEELEDVQNNTASKEIIVKVSESICENETEKSRIISEIQEKLTQSENEKFEISSKLKQYTNDIKSLRYNLNVVKNYVVELDVKLNDSKIQRIQKTVSTQTSSQIKMAPHLNCDNYCQTISVLSVDQTNQTNFIDNETENLNQKLRNCENELKTISNNYNTLQEQFNSGQKNFIEQLSTSEAVNTKLKIEINEYKELITEMKNAMTELQDDNKLIADKCQTEHIEEIENLKKHLEVAKLSGITREELIAKYHIEINELKQKYTDIQNLQDTISDLGSNLEKLHTEEIDLKKKLAVNIETVEQQNFELEDLNKKLRDRDEEIIRLQKEIKSMLQSTAHDESIMEKELKQVLKKLDDAKKDISVKTRIIEQLSCTISEHEVIKDTIIDCNKKISKLQEINNQLQSEMKMKNEEMEKFKKHRDELISKYEQSLEVSQEERNRLKKENEECKKLLPSTILHFNDKDQKTRAISNERSQYNLRENKTPKEKNDTSDDEDLSERRPRRNRRVLEPIMTPNQDQIPLVDLSESETKRTTRGTTTKVVSEKRSTRKKKLFTQCDDSYTDIIQPSPSPMSSRSLRTRRIKK